MFCVVFTPDALRDIVNMQRYFSAAGTSATADGYGGRDYSHLLREPARPYRLRTHRKLAAIPSPGLGWSHGQTVRRRQASGAGSGRRLNLASDSGAHREESC